MYRPESLSFMLIFFPSVILGDIEFKRSSVRIQMEVRKMGRDLFYVVLQPGDDFEIVCARPGGKLEWQMPSNTDLYGFYKVDFKSRVTEGEHSTSPTARFLRITKAKPTDSGFYKCQQVDQEENYREVYVYVKGDEPFLKPGSNNRLFLDDDRGLLVPCRATSHVKDGVTLYIDGIEKKFLSHRYDPRIGFKLNGDDLSNETLHERLVKCELAGKSVQYYVKDRKLMNFNNFQLRIKRYLITARHGGRTHDLIRCTLQKLPSLDFIKKHRLEIGCSNCEHKPPPLLQSGNHSTLMVQMVPEIFTEVDKYYCDWFIENDGVNNLHRSTDLYMRDPPEKLDGTFNVYDLVKTSSNAFDRLVVLFVSAVLIVAVMFIFMWYKRSRRKKEKTKVMFEKEFVEPMFQTSAPSTEEVNDISKGEISPLQVTPDSNEQKEFEESESESKDLDNETLERSLQNAEEWEPVPSQQLFAPGNKFLNGKSIAPDDIHLGTDPQLLGGGGQADVYLGRFGGEVVAVKKYKPILSNQRSYEEEVSTLLKMRHRNLLQIIGHCDAECCIVVEYCSSSLFSCIESESFKLDWILFPEWVTHLIEALHYLHQNDIIHRDIKSSNVLVSKDNVLRVCDFGVSRIASITQCTFVTFTGTPGYEAPEMRRRENYSRKVDVYSFGVVLWEMATRRNPNTELEYVPDEEKSTSKRIPPTLLLMISKCTRLNAEERPSFVELREGHLWDQAQADIRKNKKNWPEHKKDAQQSADGWNYTMDYVLPVRNC